LAPEILIVGDEGHRSSLGQRIEGLGYEVDFCRPQELNRRVRTQSSPAAILLCTPGADSGVVLAGLRRSRQGAAIPVVLVGRLGKEIKDVADVLDLGADHFLEEPIDEDQLSTVLDQLVGVPEEGPRVAASDRVRTTANIWPRASTRTEVLGTYAPKSTKAQPFVRDPMLGQLHRTLDILEARLRERAPERRERDGDEIDLAAMGPESVPDVELEAEPIDPGESQDRMDISSLGATVAFDRSLEVFAGVNARPENTVKLDRFVRNEPSWRRPRADNEVDGRSNAPRRRTGVFDVPEVGNIAELEIPRLLWRLHRISFMGHVRLQRARIDKQLWMVGGEIVFAASNLAQDRLVDEMLARGLLTRTQYDAARRLAAKQPKRAGQLLVESGFLKPNELHDVLQGHLATIVQSTFGWREGAWMLREGERCDERVLLHRPLASLLMSGVRTRVEPDTLERWLSGGSDFPRLTGRIAGNAAMLTSLADQLELTLDERDLLSRFDGKHSVSELVRADSDAAGVLSLVYALAMIELVELSGEREPEAIAEVDPVELDRQRILERLCFVREADYFELLGLPRDATKQEVRRAYRALSATFSDEHLEERTRRSMAAELREIRVALAEAHELLADDALRSAYLAHLGEP